MQALNPVEAVRGQLGDAVKDVVEYRGETTIVIETALHVRPQSGQRCSPVHLIGRAARLEIINADLRSFMHIPAWFGECGLDVTRAALCLATEEVSAAPRSILIKTA